VVVIVRNRRRVDPACRVVSSMRSRPSSPGHADELVDLVTTNVGCRILDGPSFRASAHKTGYSRRAGAAIGACAKRWILLM
jgi:hypothetical protein